MKAHDRRLTALERNRAHAPGNRHVIIWAEGMTWADALSRHERPIRPGDHVESICITSPGESEQVKRDRAIMREWMRARK